ncbi:MAG: AI-2E family transporter [Alphaproteobacteria bacterium]|nr:AI-2E family transporter [Alphaproteobacteria bacterium]
MRRGYVFWAVGLLVFFIIVYVLRGMLLPFVAGLAVAYFIDPVCDWLEEHKLSRNLATVIVTVVFFLLLVSVVVLVLPIVLSQLNGLIAGLPGYYAAVQSKLVSLLEVVQAQVAPGAQERVRELISEFNGNLGSFMTNLAQRLVSGGVALFNLLSLLVITPIVSFYLLRDWDRLVARIDALLPRHHAETIRELVREIDRRVAGFIRGQLNVCLILGTLYATALSIVGLEFGLVVGMLAGIVSFIPFVGSVLGFVVSVGLAIAQFGEIHMIAIVAGIFAAGQVLEGNFLTPKLVGERIGLHPVWVMFALLAFGSLFGFVGVLLAVPLAAVTGVMVSFALRQYLSSSYFTGRDDDTGREGA